MSVTRRTFFSRLFGAAAAVVATATTLPKLLRPAQTLQPAKTLWPDPLDAARNWGKAVLGPCEFYEPDRRGTLPAPELTISGVPIRVDERVPRNTLLFYSTALPVCLSPWPERARIVDLAPPALYGAEGPAPRVLTGKEA